MSDTFDVLDDLQLYEYLLADARAALDPEAYSKVTVGDIRAFYSLNGNGTGGRLHIVLDDYNIEDSHIEYCIASASGYNPEDPYNPIKLTDYPALRLGRRLLGMPLEEREVLIREWAGGPTWRDEEQNNPDPRYRD